jgi:hypothetical protein
MRLLHIQERSFRSDLSVDIRGKRNCINTVLRKYVYGARRKKGDRETRVGDGR